MTELWGDGSGDDPGEAVVDRTETVDLLRFSVGDRQLGVALARILEVVPMVTLRQVPGAPDAVLGIINVRGTLVPVFDLSVRIGLARQPCAASQYIVLAEAGPERGYVPFGFVVDELVDVRSLPAADACLPRSVLGVAMGPLCGAARIDDEVVPLVDLDALLAPERAAELVAPAEDEPPP